MIAYRKWREEMGNITLERSLQLLGHWCNETVRIQYSLLAQ